jgi:hypothetical protein
MTTKKQIEKAEKELNELKEKFKLQENTDFQTIKYKGKEFRIYKWESKPIKDFVYPKGFEMAEGLDLLELINKEKLIGEKYCSYFAKKIFNKGYWELFSAYLDDDGFWNAYDDNLANSNDYGRVVLVRSKYG